jgi:hypothetical protein
LEVLTETLDISKSESQENAEGRKLARKAGYFSKASPALAVQLFQRILKALG